MEQILKRRIEYKNVIGISRKEKCKPLKKKRVLKVFLILFFLILILFLFSGKSSFSNTSDENDIEKDLKGNVEEALENIDLSEFENFVSGLNSEELKLFSESSFFDRLSKALNGDISVDFNGGFSAVLNIFFGEIIDIMPLMLSIAITALLSNIVNNFKSSFKKKAVSEVIHFVCITAVILLLLTALMQVVELAKNTVNSFKMQMNISFPVLLTLITGLGGVVSTSVYQPALAILSSFIVELISIVILPMFLIATVFTVVDNLSEGIELKKLSKFFKSAALWLIGIVFTIFIAFLTIQGITAGTYDGISIRTAKYAISHSVPIIGSYIKDGFDLVLCGTVLIKNSIGICSIFILFATIITPIIKIVVFMLALKLLSAVIEPVVEKRVSGFVFNMSENMSMVIASLIGTGFMYFISIVLLIISSNTFI